MYTLYNSMSKTNVNVLFFFKFIDADSFHLDDHIEKEVLINSTFIYICNVLRTHQKNCGKFIWVQTNKRNTVALVAYMQRAKTFWKIKTHTSTLYFFLIYPIENNNSRTMISLRCDSWHTASLYLCVCVCLVTFTLCSIPSSTVIGMQCALLRNYL